MDIQCRLPPLLPIFLAHTSLPQPRRWKHRRAFNKSQDLVISGCIKWRMSAYKLHSIFREFWRCGLTLMGKWPPSLCSASLAYSFCFEYRHSTVHLSTLQSALWWKGTWGKVQRTGSGERKGGAAESNLSLKCLLCALETSCSRNKMVFCQDSQSPGWRWENRPGGGWNCWCHRTDLWVTHRKMC